MEAKHQAEKMLADHQSEFDYTKASTELAQAMAQIQAITKLRKKAQIK